MDQSIFICPVCGSPLSRDGGSFKCGNNHCYDISREGYVNLLPANRKHSREPGDSKEMLDARKFFLNRGYYKPLARSVTSAIIKSRNHSRPFPSGRKLTYCERRFPAGLLNMTPPANDFIILDAGCGEGYYSDYISKNRYAGSSSAIYGIDISREGIRSAARRNRNVHYAVAGIYSLPVADNSVNILLNIFAPFYEKEFSRVLKERGTIISVAPGAHHLYELKKYLYDEVYLNDEEFSVSENFHITETVRVKYDLQIFDKADISFLLKMTPYYHKTEPERIRSFLEDIDELKTTADFLIRIISRTDNNT